MCHCCILLAGTRKKDCIHLKSGTQSTLNTYFKSGDSTMEKPKPKAVEYSPAFFGRQTYSEQDIHNSTGLDKKHKDLCEYKGTRVVQG